MTAGILAAELVLMILIGYLIETFHIIGPSFNKDLASFITNIALPCLIVKSMQMTFSMEELVNCVWLVILGVGYLVVSFAVAFIGWKVSPKDYRGRIVRFSLVFTNFTFVGIPVTEALYGAQGVFYFVVFLVPLRIALYTLAKPLMSPSRELLKGEKKKPLGWLTPPLAAVPVGLALYVSGWTLPAIPSQIISWLSSACTPLGMILCGVSIGKYPIKSLLQKRCFVLAALRCLLMPAIMLTLCELLSIPENLMHPVVICAALPIASTSVSFITQYDTDTRAHFEMAGSVLFSTLLCTVTIPIWGWIMGRL